MQDGFSQDECNDIEINNDDKRIQDLVETEKSLKRKIKQP